MSKNRTVDISPLLAKLKAAKKLEKDGTISLKGWESLIAVEMISSILEFNEEIPSTHRRPLVHQSVLSCLKSNNLTRSSLANEISKQQQLYLNLDLDDYVVLTAISIKSSRNFFSRELNGARVLFTREMPSSFEHKSVYSEAQDLGVILPPADYHWARAKVSARSHWEAYIKGIDAIDLVRGFWNFMLNWGTGVVLFFGRPRPVNRIVNGPIHTIHLASGELSTGGYWYDGTTANSKLPPPFDLDRQEQKVFEHERLTRKMISRLDFRREIEMFLLEYNRALDNVDQNTAFFQLWRLLEKLTGTEQARYEDTVRRASRIFKHREYYRMLLNILRQIRNESIHVGSKRIDDQNYHLAQLKNIVEHLLKFFISDPFKFKNLNEAFEFLDLTDDLQKLERQIKMRENALGKRK